MSTAVVSASRAGMGSAVVADAAVALTVNVAGVGVVKTAATGGGGGGGSQAIGAIVLA